MSRTLSLFLAFGMGPPRNADEKTPKTKQLKRRIFLTGNLNFFLSPSPASFYPQKHSNKRDGLLQLCCFSTQRATFFQRYAVYEKREGAAFCGAAIYQFRLIDTSIFDIISVKILMTAKPNPKSKINRGV